MKNEAIKTKIKKERHESSLKEKHTSSSASSSSKKKNPFDLRNKLITKVKSATEQELERQKSRVKKYKSGIIMTRSGSQERSPSINSISSDDSVLSDNPSKKKRKRNAESEVSLDEEERGKIRSFFSENA